MKTQNLLGHKSTGLVCSFLLFHACSAADAGELEITSIVPSTNGIKVVWTNSLPGYAFTLQARDSLSVGNWGNAPTRYRWPSVKTNWMEATALQGRTRFYRVMAEPPPVPQRGKVLSVTLVQTLWSKACLSRR